MATQAEMATIEARNRIAAARRSQKAKSYEHTLVRKSSGLITAAFFGTLNRMNVPVSIAGFPVKLGVIALAQLGEGLSKGNMAAAMAGIADSVTAIYVERTISTSTLVAGDGESDDGGEI